MCKKRKSKSKYRPESKSRTFRKGDKMITVTTEVQPAIIDFNDILAACTVEPDDNMSAPWEEHDGWEHDLVKNVDEKYYDEWAEVKKARNVFYQDRRWYRIAISREQLIEWQGGPMAGESRQIYEERLAECRRQAIDTLRNWYEHGWQWYGVVCDFMDETSSVWGIQTEDDSEDDPYLDEVKREQAEEVAALLEKRGFTIINEPLPCQPTREYKQRALQHRIATHLGFKTREAYLAWLWEPAAGLDLDEVPDDDSRARE